MLPLLYKFVQLDLYEDKILRKNVSYEVPWVSAPDCECHTCSISIPESCVKKTSDIKQ